MNNVRENDASTSFDFVTASKQGTLNVSDEISEEEMISIYPNPVQDEVMISGVSGTAIVRLMSISGRIIE